jgi:hypothetical protein
LLRLVIPLAQAYGRTCGFARMCTQGLWISLLKSFDITSAVIRHETSTGRAFHFSAKYNMLLSLMFSFDRVWRKCRETVMSR